MRTKAVFTGLAALALLSAVSGRVNALAKNVSVNVTQQGDFVLIGNTLAQDCGGNALPHPAGAKCSGIMAGDLADRGPDIFWQASGMTVKADDTVTMDQSASAAALKIPAGAEITHAWLFWSARVQSIGQTDDKVTLECAGKAPIEVTASGVLQKSETYHGSADVTNYVKMNGECTYVVSGVTSFDYKSFAQPDASGHSGWWMVVVYEDLTMPHRLITLFAGLDDISNGGFSDSLIESIKVPNNFNVYSDAKVGVVAYEGDVGLPGDQFLLVDPVAMTSVALKDNANNENDFFNSSRSLDGVKYSVAGDLPAPSGDPGTMSHLDIDIVDITAHLKNGGQTQIQFTATSIEPVLVAGIITSIPTFTDADMDGLSDDEELQNHTNPNDADSDDDGVADGVEGCSNLATCTEPGWNVDTDGDGLINALDPDADNDGLFDGTELGLDCNSEATDASQGHCRADADSGTKTDPLDADTDDGGVSDGAEDFNLDGKVDGGETDPTTGHGSDDVSVVDSDGDGLSDGLEDVIGSDKNDTDSDDDGLPDGQEANPSDDTDGDGLLNVNDVDSDNDGLFDGTETGKNCDDLGNPANPGHCIPDADGGQTTTSPVNPDTDYGGATDGAEDGNLNGAQDQTGETDPTAGHPQDDGNVVDSDGDGLSDLQEGTLGSDPNDADTDDDGVRDGLEPNPSDDTDGDGKNNVNDPDSDGDGLFDGTEMGLPCSDPATDKSAGTCKEDGDKGKTTTSPVDADTDDGGVTDGGEDFDKDGVYDANQGEGNPLDPSDDTSIQICDEDSDCGPPNSGKVCDIPAMTCVDGCRTDDDCPDPKVCKLEAGSVIGYCADPGTSSGDNGQVEVQGGCLCELPNGDHSSNSYAVSLLAAACAAMVSRRRKRSA